MNKYKVSRKTALKWWNSLTFKEKFIKTVNWLVDNYKDTAERHPDTLTGREIEEIYNLYH